MNIRLLNTLACPVCTGKLEYDQQKQQLICAQDQLAYPIIDNIPVLLAEQAISLNEKNHDEALL